MANLTNQSSTIVDETQLNDYLTNKGISIDTSDKVGDNINLSNSMLNIVPELMKDAGTDNNLEVNEKWQEVIQSLKILINNLLTLNDLKRNADDQIFQPAASVDDGNVTAAEKPKPPGGANITTGGGKSRKRRSRKVSKGGKKSSKRRSRKVSKKGGKKSRKSRHRKVSKKGGSKSRKSRHLKKVSKKGGKKSKKRRSRKH